MRFLCVSASPLLTLASLQSLEVLERELLNGQKLQGPQTAQEVNAYLKERNLTDEFPLFTQTYRICYEGAAPQSLFAALDKTL